MTLFSIRTLNINQIGRSLTLTKALHSSNWLKRWSIVCLMEKIWATIFILMLLVTEKSLPSIKSTKLRSTKNCLPASYLRPTETPRKIVRSGTSNRFWRRITRTIALSSSTMPLMMTVSRRSFVTSNGVMFRRRKLSSFRTRSTLRPWRTSTTQLTSTATSTRFSTWWTVMTNSLESKFWNPSTPYTRKTNYILPTLIMGFIELPPIPIASDPLQTTHNMLSIKRSISGTTKLSASITIISSERWWAISFCWPLKGRTNKTMESSTQSFQTQASTTLPWRCPVGGSSISLKSFIGTTIRQAAMIMLALTFLTLIESSVIFKGRTSLNASRPTSKDTFRKWKLKNDSPQLF